MKNLSKLFFIAALLTGTTAHAANGVRVLVRAEHSGTDIVYHYTLVNGGPGRMVKFSIGVEDANDGGARYFGTLTRLPTGTTFIVDTSDPERTFPDELPVLNPGSITTPSQPPGWTVRLGGRGLLSSPTRSLIWTAPEPHYEGPYDITGADAGQTLTGFSIRVPASGPGTIDTYWNSEIFTKVWTGTHYFQGTELYEFGRLEKQDIVPPTLAVTLTPSTMRSGSRLLSIAATITAKDNYDPLPEIKLESITANQTLSSSDISGALYGTDDRAFKLKPVKGRIYTVTYSATDGSGNKTLATGTVTVR